jgi:hypothetical protein
MRATEAKQSAREMVTSWAGGAQKAINFGCYGMRKYLFSLFPQNASTKFTWLLPANA